MSKMPLYVVFGYKGILGNAFFKKLSNLVPSYRIFAFGHEQVNVADRDQVKEVLEYIRPTIVFNCSGVSSLENCEKAPNGAATVNVIGSKVVGETCASIGAKMVWFSSAHVFGGGRRIPYSERCNPQPSNSLGRTKAEGERVALASSENNLIIRPGWVFDSGPGLITQWLDQLDRGMVVSIRPNRTGSAIFLSDLVDTTMDLLSVEAKGIYHVANSGIATFEDMVHMVSTGSVKAKAKAKKANTNQVASSMLAPFPDYSVLSCKKCESLIKKKMRPWQMAMKQCLFQMKRYKP
jgi:dTDP-4-dehydrorhamnose reductase